MENLQILGAPQSPLVWAVRMAAVEKGVNAELIFAPPHSPEIEAIQPFGKMPAMRHDGVEVGESRAIALYIDGIGTGKPLMPRNLADAARAEQWIMHYHTEYMPLMLGRYIVPSFFPTGPGGKPDRNVIDPALPAMEKSIAILEKRLDGRDYLAGDFTLADIFFAPTLHYVSVLPEGSDMMARAPRVTALLARAAERPGIQGDLPAAHSVARCRLNLCT